MFYSLMTRSQPRLSPLVITIAALFAAGTIAVLAVLEESLGFPLLVAAFGASCVLVFTLPHSPLSQPINIVGGYMVAVACGLLARFTLPVTWWSLALSVSVTLAAMAALRLTHPPAGGTPIAVLWSHEGWLHIIAPILLGSLILAAGALTLHAATTWSGHRDQRTTTRA